MKATTLLLPILATLSLAFMLTGCGTAELEPAYSLESGDYQIEILAPGGEFREGEIPLKIHVTRNGETVELNDGRLDLHMLEMGAMPRMDTGVSFTKNGNQLEGDIFFEMDGGWQGSIEIITEDGETISESIRVNVR